MFGADPVTGHTNRIVVSAVRGGPDQLVSGQVDGVQFKMSRRGRLGEATDPLPGELRSRRTRRQLVRLARQVSAVFGSPQDVEWAIDHDDRLVLLQTRPITAVGCEALAGGPVFGPGPVAETFALRLRPLEEDLWVSPLREEIREALTIAGTTPPRKLQASPLVVVVDGWVAADLDVLGVTKRRRSRGSSSNAAQPDSSEHRRIDPAPPTTRLATAVPPGRWRGVGA